MPYMMIWRVTVCYFSRESAILSAAGLPVIGQWLSNSVGQRIAWFALLYKNFCKYGRPYSIEGRPNWQRNAHAAEAYIVDIVYCDFDYLSEHKTYTQTLNFNTKISHSCLVYFYHLRFGNCVNTTGCICKPIVRRLSISIRDDLPHSRSDPQGSQFGVVFGIVQSFATVQNHPAAFQACWIHLTNPNLSSYLHLHCSLISEEAKTARLRICVWDN